MIFIVTNSILINFNSFPISYESLLPDNGLATLAAYLFASGNKTKILDYGTIDSIERFVSDDCRIDLQRLWGGISSNKATEKDFEELSRIENELNKFQGVEIQAIAEELSDLINKEDISWIGFKLWNNGFKASIRLASELKKRFPKLKVFGGGPHVDWFKEKILDITDAFDALCYGEGEETITLLSDYVEGRTTLEQIPNLIFKKDERVQVTPPRKIANLDELLSPIYDPGVYPAMANDQKAKLLLLDESRGCPMSCNFCIHPIKSGRKWRTKDPSKIVSELEEMARKYKTKAFRFSGSNTPPDLKGHVAKKLMESTEDIEYGSFGHARSGLTEDYSLLRKSGCYSLFFGIESGSQEILDKAFNKKVKVEQSKEALIRARQAGIFTVASIIYPAPFETEQTTKETLDFLLYTRPDSVTVQFPGVIPGTEWAKNAAKYNIKIDPDYEKRFIMYELRMLFPLKFWEPLPYSIDGKPHSQFTEETDRFVRTLEQNGMLTSVSDIMALMARFAGMQHKEGEFRDQSREYFFTANYKRIGEVVKKMNSNMQNET